MQEAAKVLADMGLAPRTREEQACVKRLIADMDTDGSAQLEFAEFDLLYQRVSERLRIYSMNREDSVARRFGFSETDVSEMRWAFNEFDEDGSNALSMEEVRRVLRLLRVRVNAQRFRNVFNEVDKDQSGELEFSEFLTLMHMITRQESIFAKEPDVLPSSIEAFPEALVRQTLSLFPLNREFVNGLNQLEGIRMICDYLNVEPTCNPIQIFEAKTWQEFLDSVCDSMDLKEREVSQDSASKLGMMAQSGVEIGGALGTRKRASTGALPMGSSKTHAEDKSSRKFGVQKSKRTSIEADSRGGLGLPMLPSSEDYGRNVFAHIADDTTRGAAFGVVTSQGSLPEVGQGTFTVGQHMKKAEAEAVTLPPLGRDGHNRPRRHRPAGSPTPDKEHPGKLRQSVVQEGDGPPKVPSPSPSSPRRVSHAPHGFGPSQSVGSRTGATRARKGVFQAKGAGPGSPGTGSPRLPGLGKKPSQQRALAGGSAS